MNLAIGANSGQLCGEVIEILAEEFDLTADCVTLLEIDLSGVLSRAFVERVRDSTIGLVNDKRIEPQICAQKYKAQEEALEAFELPNAAHDNMCWHHPTVRRGPFVKTVVDCL